jgi:hypothetical protein
VSNFDKFGSGSGARAKPFWEGPGDRVQKGVGGFVDGLIGGGIYRLFKGS